MVWIISTSPINDCKRDAPEVSDHEENNRVKKDRDQVDAGGRELRSPAANGRPSKGKGWPRTSDSGSTTTSSTGSYCGGRFSPETTPRRSSSGRGARFQLGRDSEQFRTIGGDFDDLGELDSESDEQPAELVPLGMRSLNLSGCRNHRRRKARINFHDFYKLTDDHLGSGAYASVKTGVSIATGKEFAVKLVDKHEPGHTRSRIMREVETFNMCKNHPNIVQLHEWFEDRDYFYMVFEKMRGGPLLNHIQQKGFFTEQEASKVTRDIANALKYLHDRGIAHRDVKPENVLCSDFDHVSPVKLCDLDLASKAASPSPPKLQSVNSEPDLASPVGSAEFMAPEVVDAFVGDALKYDKRCDMWSLGVIVYIMLCGYPPFYGQCWRENCGWDQGLPCNECQENLFKRIQRGEFDFPESEWETVSEEAKDLICHLLVKNVRERFTADEVLKHPWIRNGAPETKLQTPGNLFRNDSARDVHQMQEHFNVMNRIVAARLSARLERNELETDDDGTGVGRHKQSVTLAEACETNNNDMEKGTPAVITAKPPNGLVQQSDLVIAPIPAEAAAPAEVLSGPNAVVRTPIQYTGARIMEEDGVLTDAAEAPANVVAHSVARAEVPVGVAAVARIATETRHAPSPILMPPPPVPVMPHGAHVQMPVHVSQMAMANGLAYGGGLPMSGGMGAMPAPIPFHPNQMINMNAAAMYLYPRHLIAQPLYAPQHFAVQQQMYKVGVVPQQFMAPPPLNGMRPLYEHRGSTGYGLMGAATKKHRSANHFRETATPPACFPTQKNNAMLAVRSAATLNVQPVGAQQIELETCQTAMARQDSKGELRAQARETQVNV